MKLAMNRNGIDHRNYYGTTRNHGLGVDHGLGVVDHGLGVMDHGLRVVDHGLGVA